MDNTYGDLEILVEHRVLDVTREKNQNLYSLMPCPPNPA